MVAVARATVTIMCALAVAVLVATQASVVMVVVDKVTKVTVPVEHMQVIYHRPDPVVQVAVAWNVQAVVLAY
jgi:hypothetical protein